MWVRSKGALRLPQQEQPEQPEQQHRVSVLLRHASTRMGQKQPWVHGPGAGAHGLQQLRCSPKEKTMRPVPGHLPVSRHGERPNTEEPRLAR
jgi:hypothetical protein